MPVEIEAVFDSLNLPLFPTTLDLHCSCPDWGYPCKHASAVLYLLAESFDDDPFLVLAWRGRARAELLDALRAAGPGSGAASASDPGAGPSATDPLAGADAPLPAEPDRFYAPTVSLRRLRERITVPAIPPELLLRAVAPPPVKVRHIPLVDLLRPAYRRLPGDD
jgi:uncharacterized Zn finger protein